MDRFIKMGVCKTIRDAKIATYFTKEDGAYIQTLFHQNFDCLFLF